MLYAGGVIATFSLMPDSQSSELATTLLAHRDRFKGFVASRIGSDADAEDILQNGLVKALRAAGDIKDEEKLLSWFYQILRNVIVDHVRSRTAAAKRDESWMLHTTSVRDDAEAERQICGCFERMLPSLRPKHATLLRRVELHGEPVSTVAAELGMTPNHASVALSRARAELRDKLTRFCGDCSCLDDCSCGEAAN